VLPGTYQIKLTVDQTVLTQPLEVVMDPRVKTREEDLKKQYTLGLRIYRAVESGEKLRQEILKFYTSKAAQSPQDKIQAIREILPEGPEPDSAPQSKLVTTLGTLTRMATVIDSADTAPTEQATKAAEDAMKEMDALLAKWQTVR